MRYHSVGLPENVHRALQKLSEKRGIPMCNLAKRILCEYFERHNISVNKEKPARRF